jgi:hypothetical protein
MMSGQRVVADPFGWGAAAFECECFMWWMLVWDADYVLYRACDLYTSLARGWEDEEGRYPTHL